MTPADDIAAIDAALADFVGIQTARLAPLGADLAELVSAAETFIAGGKRLRPAFCLAGWRIATGTDPATPVPHPVAVAAGSLEWLQASALIHDDLMDGSDTRRGRPSVHRDFETRHRDRHAVGDARGFGASTAVLLGDLTLAWCDEMIRSAGNVPGPFIDTTGQRHLAAAFAVLDVCKTEVIAGQFLDVITQTRAHVTPREAMLVVRYKAAKYTVERPLHLGATLAGADPSLLEGLTRVALPLGEAFQLRDDVLGVFGDPEVTGKPAGDDLREGKRTLLVARAAELADDAGRTMLTEQLGTDDGVAQVRDLIESSGARTAVEADIDRLTQEATQALAVLGPEAESVLGPLLERAVRRDS